MFVLSSWRWHTDDLEGSRSQGLCCSNSVAICRNYSTWRRSARGYPPDSGRSLGGQIHHPRELRTTVSYYASFCPLYDSSSFLQILALALLQDLAEELNQMLRHDSDRLVARLAEVSQILLHPGGYLEV